MKHFVAISIAAALTVSPVFTVENPVVTKISSAVRELESLPPQTNDEELANRISLLGKKLTQADPDVRRLMAGLVEYMTTSESAPQLGRMLWPSIATPQERAQFLADEIGQTQQSQIGFVAALVEREMVDQQTVAKYPEARDAIGLGREVLYSGTAFIPIMQDSGGVNPRLAAIWFSKAPYQAALACLGSNDEEARLQLRRVNDLRFEIENGKTNGQKTKACGNLDQELQTLFLSGSPVLEMYAAGVLKWRRTVAASFSDSEALTLAINKCSNPVVSCILQGINTKTLTSLPSETIVLVTTANTRLAPTATATQTTPAPAAVTPVEEPKSTPSPTPAVTVETTSTPWPWIIAAILLLVVVGGATSFKFLRK